MSDALAEAVWFMKTLPRYSVPYPPCRPATHGSPAGETAATQL